MKSNYINIKTKLIIILALVAISFSNYTRAQVSVQINIGAQPVWGPVGYDYVEYYYMPDMDMYYDVRNGHYVYYDNSGWVTMRSMPPRYQSYDLYTIHKVVINEPSPWTHHDRYKTKYAKYKGHHGQHVIKNSNNAKYWANPGHPKHANWKGNNGNNGHNKGQGRNDRQGNSRQNDNRNMQRQQPAQYQGEKHNGHGGDKGNGHGNSGGHGRGNGNGKGHGKGK